MTAGVQEAPQMGLVFIPDISGFTELVRSTDLATGNAITCELLTTLTQANVLGMEIAEIEGDAIFFFKWKSMPAVDELYEQFERMKSAFDCKVAAVQAKYGITLDLQLKAIAHYGAMTGFSVQGFQKLYGEVVIEAHRLLKNKVPGRSYLLVTDELMEASRRRPLTSSPVPVKRSSKLCELYRGLRRLCFTYFGFEYAGGVSF